MTCDEVVRILEAQADPGNVAGMARFGIRGGRVLGISIPFLRRLARQIGRDHRLAGELWRTGIHEARLLAGFIDEPARVTESQMERWVRDLESWDVCDQVMSNLFDRTPFAHRKIAEWTARPEEFVKRAGFVLMAALAVHDKAAANDLFLEFLPIIEREASDPRNFVKKAVNWALRQIGKRNKALHKAAVACAKRILAQESAAARWIARDALREFAAETTCRLLEKRG